LSLTIWLIPKEVEGDLQFFQDNAFGVGSTLKGVVLEGGTKGALLVIFIGPALVLAMCAKLTSSI